MNFSKSISLFLGTAILAAGGVLQAQESTDDAAVWKVVESQWERSQRDDSKWIEDLLSAKFVGWSYESPAPRTRESTAMWEKFNSKQWKGKAHELYPLSIVVHGDTAIAHYLYSNAGEDAEGETRVIHGRFTDVLVREDGQWKFLAWHGGADSDDD